MTERCPTCFQPLWYRDNDDPLLNCVARCENPECSDPFVELYYEEPTDADVFRKTDEWEEAFYDATEEFKESKFSVVPRTEDNVKRADALYLKRHAS